MLYEDKDIPELNYMKHRHDNVKGTHNWWDTILKKNISSYMYNNTLMAQFLDKLQKPLTIFFDQHNIVRNFKNYIVDKYYYRQPD